AAEIWRDAKDQVDNQLRALADGLRKTGVPVMGEIAKEVETLLERARVGIVAALLDYDRAPTDPKLRIAALDAVKATSDWLQSDERVEAVDKNPLGLPVTAAATLGAALRQLQIDLAKSGGPA
ncbi:MAG TPA: hypothetical protein VE650_07115, partial [Acetobacteraceae bacterium]|nr:hypothetical protein [Acetobacteraceae bacterium]